MGASLALGHYQRWDCLKLGSSVSQSVPEQSGQSDTPVSHVGALGGSCFFLFPVVLCSAVSAELFFVLWVNGDFSF